MLFFIDFKKKGQYNIDYVKGSNKNVVLTIR